MASTINRGQLVAVQAAFVALLAAWSAGAVPLALVAPVALATTTFALVRVRGKWAYAWLALALRYAVRRRTRSAGASPEALLGLAESATLQLDGRDVTVITDIGGPTAVVALGDDDALLSEPGPPLPPLATLLPGEPGQPAVRLRLVAAAVAAPAPGTAGPAATSYRQLTGGSTPAYRRVLLAVQLRRAAGADEAALRRALISAVRRICRRLDRRGITARPVGPGAAPRVLAELTHEERAGVTTESWSGLVVGGRHQATFRLEELGGEPPPGTVSLPARLLALPGSAVTLAIAVEGPATDTHVRLAATGPAELTAAVEALQAQLTAAGVTGHRLDGAHLGGLAATLPFGGPGPLAATNPTSADYGHPHDVTPGGDGVVLGANRRGEPVVFRLFRGEPTRVVLVGPVPRAQLVALRALAVGARVYLSTGRPAAWEAFLRAVSGPGTTITMTPPGRGVDAPAAVPLRPQLVILDGGSLDHGATATATLSLPEVPWRTTLAVRGQLGPGDVDLLARADLALLTPVSQPEAVLAGTALGLGDTADWLTRIRGDMFGAVLPRRTVRWAMATPTPLERQILGLPPA